MLIFLGKRNSHCCQRKVLFVHLFSQSQFCLENQLKGTVLDSSMTAKMGLHLKASKDFMYSRFILLFSE